MLCWAGNDQPMKMRATSRGQDKKPVVNNNQKTAMAIGTTFTANRDRRKMLNVVFCPDHLVKKWRDELERFAPLSDIHIIDSIDELAEMAPKFHDRANRLHHQWIILAKDTAKYGYDERPAAVWSKKRKCYVCPECGKPLYVEIKDPEDHSRHPRRIKHFFGPLAFLKHNNANHVCMHKKTKKCLNDKGVFEYVKGEDCNTKLWTPVIKGESDFGAGGEWVKLGKAGWIERCFMRPTYERLDAMQQAYNNLPADQKRGKTPFPAKSGYETVYRELRKIFAQGKNIPPQRAPRKFSLTKYLLKYFKHELDYVILDEMQELKGGESIQGECFGDLAFAAQHIIGLTGTLMNGYASGLYYMLYRSKPKLLAEEGFEYGNTMPFSRAYGRIQEKYVLNDSGRMRKQEDKELAGASPLLFTRFLLNNAVFMDLSDIAEGLPEYEEIPVGVDMDQELNAGYANLYQQVTTSFGDWGQMGRIMGQALVSLATYPDMPYNQPPIIDRDTRDTVATPVDLPEIPRAKEEAFLEIVQEKVNAGEKVLVYYNWVNRTDTPDKLTQLLEDLGIATAVLRTSSDGGPDARDRQEWIEEQVANGAQVLMCNPKLVETGLDLLDFTTIIWYQMGTNLFTMRQACRRSLRLNQTHDVKVYFLYYRNTIQESTLIRMADKVKAARALEGHFSEEGLNAMSSDDDLETQIIKDMASGLQQHLDEQNAFAGNRIHNENRQSSIYQRTSVERNVVDFSRITSSKKKQKNTVSLDDSLDLLDSICC